MCSDNHIIYDTKIGNTSHIFAFSSPLFSLDLYCLYLLRDTREM